MPAIEDVYGAPVVAPKDPTWEGHVFIGWTNAGSNVVALPSYMPDNNPTYTAKWKVLQPAPQLEVQAAARSAEVKNPVVGAEYVIVPAGQEPGAKDWANAKRAEGGNVVFEGLSPATSYDVWARMSETDEAAQSEAAKVTVATPKEQQEAPGSEPNAWAVNPTTVAVKQGSGAQEYALVPKGSSVPGADSDAWKSPGGDGRVEWSGLEPNTEYDVYARMKGSDTKEPSGPTPSTTVKTPVVTVTNVVLNSEGAKKVYIKGEALDAGGLTLEVTKSDGSTQTVDVTSDMISGFDGNTVGTQMLTVVYEGFTNTYEIEVREGVPPVTTYEVTVANGTGGGRHAEGESVTIVASEPAAGKRFKEWDGADDLTFTNGGKATATATFTMPTRDVAVTATYEDVPAEPGDPFPAEPGGKTPNEPEDPSPSKPEDPTPGKPDETQPGESGGQTPGNPDDSCAQTPGSHAEAGADRFRVEIREGAPAIDASNKAEVVGAALTQGELDGGYGLLLVSSPYEEGGVPDADRAALLAEAGELGATPAAWFDISLFKVRGGEATKLDEVATPVRITAEVPEDMCADGRTFVLLRAHNGKVKRAAEDEGDSLAWETGEFSTYLLAYKDAGSQGPDARPRTRFRRGPGRGRDPLSSRPDVRRRWTMTRHQAACHIERDAHGEGNLPMGVA